MEFGREEGSINEKSDKLLFLFFVFLGFETQATWLLSNKSALAVLVRPRLEKIHLDRNELRETQLSLPTCTHRRSVRRPTVTISLSKGGDASFQPSTSKARNRGHAKEASDFCRSTELKTANVHVSP